MTSITDPEPDADAEADAASSLDPKLLKLIEAMAVADVDRDFRDHVQFVWV